MLAANKNLIEAGAGTLLIPYKVMLEFSALLLSFYESGDFSDLQGFLYNKAIYGMDSAGVGSAIESATEIATVPAIEPRVPLSALAQRRG